MLKTVLCALLALTGVVSTAQASDAIEVLRQGDTVVTLDDVNGFLQRMPDKDRAGFLSSGERVNRMLISILRDKQLAQQATALKLDQNEDVRDQIEAARNDILAKRRVAAFEAGLKVPSMEAAAKEQYLAHKGDYVVPGMVNVRHILITEKGRTEAEAKALAEQVHNEAVQDPASFEKLVVKYSEDGSKVSNQGLIRDAGSDHMAREFAAAAKKLNQVGEISPVIKTQFGFHVLQLVSKTPARSLDYDAVKAELQEKLRQDYVAERRTAFLNKLDDNPASANAQGIEAMVKKYGLSALPNIGDVVHAAGAK